MSAILKRDAPLRVSGTPASDAAAVPAPSTPMQHDIAAIARLHGDASFSYGDLRARGIALTQAASGQLWTDYNLHDPGVTLLESLCYALTEGVFGAQADIADLLTAADGHIHYRQHALHGAEDALPCRPTTELDLLRYLLDRVPAVRQLRLQMDADGLWQMALRVSDEDGAAAARHLTRAYHAARNLCEDLRDTPKVLKPRWCALEISLSVEGPRDPGDVLVELVRRCADIVSAAPPRQPLQARLGQRDALGQPAGTAELFDGPVLRCGWIADEALRDDPANRLHFSDLARALREIDGVTAISALRLVPLATMAGGSSGAEASDVSEVSDAEDDPAGTSLPWHGEDWALQLRWPDVPAMLDNWQVSQRGSRVHLDTRALLAKFADARQAQRVASSSPRTAPFTGRLFARPSGRYLPDAPYLSIWHHLPPLYREYHLAPRADAERQAQFGAYLALIEQWQAHGNAQMQQVRQMYSIEAEPRESYWWAPLDGSDIPGLAGVNARTADATRALLAADDDAIDRRGRVLDLLLSLHGESCDQHAIQRFGVYYDQAVWQQHLYACKRQFLRRIVRHTRDRAGAFDYSRPSLGRRGNTAPLQERIGLLLGFSQAHSRRLTGTLAMHGMAIDERAHRSAEQGLPQETRQGPAHAAPKHAEPLMMWPPLRSRIVAHFDEDVALRAVHERLSFHFTDLDSRAMPAALLRCAAHAGRYHRAEATTGSELWLGPDENGQWWRLAVRAGQTGVVAPALYLHELACRVQREAEGLHLVEHVLLRPLGNADGDISETFYANRVSLFLPGWTARGADQSFRDLATGIIAQACPAHIQPNVHWLDHAALTAFEQEFEAWLDARVALAREAGNENAASVDGNAAVAARVDTCAAALRRRLQALASPGAAR